MKAKKIGVKHAILGRSDTNLPLRRRYDLARRIMGTDLDLKTAREMSAKSAKVRSNGNRRIAGQTPFFQIGRSGELVYATVAGNLSPLRAQLDLALPRSNSAQAIFEVDTSLINQEPVLVRPVTGNVFYRPGGGTEYIFGRPFPSGSFTRVQ